MEKTKFRCLSSWLAIKRICVMTRKQFAIFHGTNKILSRQTREKLLLSRLVNLKKFF